MNKLQTLLKQLNNRDIPTNEALAELIEILIEADENTVPWWQLIILAYIGYTIYDFISGVISAL